MHGRSDLECPSNRKSRETQSQVSSVPETCSTGSSQSDIPRRFRQIIFFDLETTGFAPLPLLAKSNQIVQIAAKRLSDGRFFQSFVNPQMYIPPHSSKLHHIHNRDVEDAPPWPRVLSNFISEMEIDDETCLVAHNSKWFDEIVLKRCSMETGSLGLLPQGVVFWDTLLYMRANYPDMPSYRLGDLHEFFFDEPIENAHRADADVEALMRVFQHCIKEPELSRWSPKPPVFVSDLRFIGPYRTRIVRETTGATNILELASYFGGDWYAMNRWLYDALGIASPCTRMIIIAQVSKIDPWNVQLLSNFVPLREMGLEGAFDDVDYYVSKRYMETFERRNDEDQEVPVLRSVFLSGQARAIHAIIEW